MNYFNNKEDTTAEGIPAKICCNDNNYIQPL